MVGSGEWKGVVGRGVLLQGPCGVWWGVEGCGGPWPPGQGFQDVSLVRDGNVERGDMLGGNLEGGCLYGT